MSESNSIFQELVEKDLYRVTPLIESSVLTQLTGGIPVYLKLDCLQKSGSFKDRGMAYLCYKLQQEQGIGQIISSSGGNAGLAAATIAQQLTMDCVVVVPTTTKPLVIDKLKSLGATVQVHGDNWNQADDYVQQLVQDHPNAAYIPPYQHEWLWTGHSTLIDEILLQQQQPLPSNNNNKKNTTIPNFETILLSVGGGGLLCGVLEGLTRSSNNNNHTMRVLACETRGCHSFHLSWEAQQLQSLDKIDSIATSLGALTVSPTALQRSMDYTTQQQQQHRLDSVVVSDKQCVQAIDAFCRDHKLLVEPACGAALAVVYDKELRERYITGPTVVEVCGGSGVNLELLQSWKEQFGV